MHMFSLISNAIRSIGSFISDNTGIIVFGLFSYIFIAGGLYFVFYFWKRKELWKAKIQVNFPSYKHTIRDIKYSFSSLIVFGIVVFPIAWAKKHGLTLIYTPIDKYGYVYYFFSIFLMIVVHDTYFYWTHRLLHWKKIFKWTHQTHHLTHNPTPFSAYAFHPIEALVQVGIVPLIAFTIPAHISAIAIFLIHQMFLNVFGHLGYEMAPKSIRNKFFKWSNTATHHNMHHTNVKYNFGLYFNFWDKIMHTNHPHYEDNFDKVIARKLGKDIPKNSAVSKEEKINASTRKSLIKEHV